MKRANRYFILDICAMTVALVALTGTIAAMSALPAAQVHAPARELSVVLSVAGICQF